MLRCKPQTNLNAPRRDGESSMLRLKPLAQAIALLMMAGNAHAATAFSSAWFAAKGASQAGGAGRPTTAQPGMPPPLAQQQRANAQLQRSLTNLNNTVAAIAAQQAAQAAGRQAALGQIQVVPDGLGEGGLKVDNSLTQGWLNAKGPQQTQVGGKTTVKIEQTADKAILNWETFNVGRNTTVDFQQQSDWAVLNRVNDPQARPSQIQGQIKGNGTVMLVNRNGIIFSGSSQVNVRNLAAVAANVSDEQFSKRGLYVDATGSQPTFTDAAGKVEVQQGALIETHRAATSTAGGGYALLLGSEVENAGSIITAKGQTTLAAGDSFYIRRGQGTSGNLRSTTRGNEVATSLKPGSSAGTVINSGLIQASTGDITLTGHRVEQNGVVVATSSVDTRGTVHLLNAFSDSTGSVTLGLGSATAVLLDAAGGSALDSQRNAGPAGLDGTPNNLITGQFNNLSSVVDRTDQSRVEIVSGGSVDFQNGSITLATGGQVAVSAAGRSLVRDGAVIDVSGAIGVKVAMESNSIKVNVQGNEQRDAPVNREDGKLTNNDVWVDVRDLIYVPAGTNGYVTDRWYTAGGLLEVGGYLGTRGHSVGEWAAQGGTLTFTGNDVVTQQAAQLNLSGGTLDVQSGYLRQSWLKGPNGRLYDLSKAPGDILYSGIYKGYEDHSQRWGQTDYYYNPLIAPRERFEAGYTVGRDAGKLVVSTRNAVLEGQIVGEVYQGERQTQAPNLNLDGYQQSQNAVARRAQLWVGSYTPIYDKTAGVINSGLNPTFDQVTVGKVTDKIAAGLDLTSVVRSDRQGKLVLDNELLNGFQLGAVKVAALEGIKVDDALKVADGGDITLYAPQVEVNADLTARSGRIALGNVLKQIRTDNFQMADVVLSPATGQRAGVTLGEGVTLNTAGRWSNLLLDGNDRQGLPFLNGGTVSVRSSGDIDVRQGSLIDVSSGAAVMADGKTRGGKGGDLTLTASTGASSGNGALNLDGELRGTGVNGGGTLTLAASKVLIGNSGSPLEPGTLQLGGDFFDKGFSAYDITGNQGLTVAEGTQVDVTMPVYRFGEQALSTGSDAEPADALQRWTPALYQEDAIKGVMTQRRGASLSLTAGTANSSAADMASTVLNLGKGSVISVDPGQGIDVRSIGQLTANGTLNAWGGRVSLTGLSVIGTEGEAVNAQGHGRSIWLGEQALIDVSSRAVTAQDMRGQTYGLVRDGGQIVIGGQIDAAKGSASASELFVVVREGARLQADGSQAVLDIPGQGRTSVASNGGSISLASANGLYLDGAFSARSGGTGAAGGKLSVALETPYYVKNAASDRVMKVRELVLGQTASASLLEGNAEAADSLVYGHGRLGVDQVQSGGFDSLALLSNGLLSIEGDVSLSLGQSLSLYARSFVTSGAAPNTRAQLNASHVLLSGPAANLLNKDNYVRPVVDGGVSLQTNKAVFSVNADLLDVQGNVTFSSKGTVRQADDSTVELERAGFDRVQLSSRGDVRFLAGFSSEGLPSGFTTQLVTPADMLLQAAQLYPATGVGARVLAGYGWGRDPVNNIPLYDPMRSLVIGRTTQVLPQVPYSVFGRLQLGSAKIEQGGVVRAPLGLLEVGTNNSLAGVSARVDLLPGSLTSVSGQGLVLPYGGTVDGQSYQYAGKKVVLLGQGAVPSTTGDLNIGVILGGKSVAAQEGSVLDLSGGGELLGAGFISGRGGSTDARFNPLVQIGANGGFTLPGLSSNPVYAIVPGNQSAYAPVAPEGGAVDPRVGQQITIGTGVPGLAAGTYTLMPSTYALLPGAFRVEVNGLAGPGSTTGAQQMRNGSWSTAGVLSIANTGQRNSLSSQVILTSGEVLRRYSQYNETSYAQFAMADAARLGVPRAMLPIDAKTLKLSLSTGAGDQAFSFKGIGKFAPQKGGYGGTVAVVGSTGSALEVVADGRGATAGFEGVTLNAESLNALNASRQVIGGLFSISYGQSGNYVIPQFDMSRNVILREGATLAAPEVFLLASGGEVLVEQGAAINTIGRGAAAYDARDGFIYSLLKDFNMLAASNGLLNVLAPPSGSSGSINIGGCSLTPCSGVTRIHSEGSIVAATGGGLELNDQVRYGTRHLTLALSNINVGTAQALSDAATRQVLPAGLTLSQTVLNRLLRGDTQYGAPALETLELSAREALNFYGTVSLDTYDPTTGKSRLNNLMLSTPAIYGAGSASDVATIRTANLIWNGAVGAPGSVIAGGAGTGAGRLDIQAQRIEFGYGAFTQPSSITTLDRLALGFANVNLSASERVTANHKGSLAVYQSQGAYDAKTGYAYNGGNLNILTPLLTGEAGSVNRITAGGALNVTGASAKPGTVSGLGGELSLKGASLNLASAVVLPSGKLTLSATDDLTLADEALIDVAGRTVTFNDVTRYSAGGEVILQSQNGNIRQANESSIDFSARNNQAGRLSAVALDEAAGIVDLHGRILGSSTGEYDAGGTAMPYLAGGVEIQAQRLGGSGNLSEQFAALNQRLNDGQVFGSRSFQLKQGDLVIGNELKASSISVSLDNGSLLVNGTVDASGERVGSIYLAAKNALTLGSGAVLDAHGRRLRVDSYGKIIDSPNRAIVDLTAREGLLTLGNGARIDLRHGTEVALGSAPGMNDGRARGTLQLSAPRLGGASGGDVAIDASGALDIQGARSISLVAMWQYSDAPLIDVPSASGKPYQVINQAWLDEFVHKDNTAFITNALDNDDLLQRKLAGLNNSHYRDVLHLRPGVEVVSATADGDLVVQGDLDLSRYRYESLNPHNVLSGVYGSGESGSLTLRAGGDLNIYGSITDGFAQPPASNDDKGWVLLPGIDFAAGDIVVPGTGVTLADDTAFPAGSVLNFDVPLKGATLAAGTRLPVAATLDQPLVLPAGTVLAAAVHDASGNLLFAAGTLLATTQTLEAGTVLGAGSLLGSSATIGSLVWPKGVALPGIADASNGLTNVLRLNGTLALSVGSKIPSGTDIKLPTGVESVQLRPEVAGSNWALAPMLAEGSQSWSLRLVAGADTRAADSRVVQPVLAGGDLHLADSHYGMFGKAGAGGMVWTEEGAENFGDPSLAGKFIDFENVAYPGMCEDSPSFCKASSGFVWTEEGAENFLGDPSYAGQPIDFENVAYPGMCDDTPSFCKAVGQTEYKPGSQRWSVIRTGAADLELLSAGDLKMDSLYGVYTAGSSASETYANDPYNQPKALGAGGKVLNDALGENEQFVDGGTNSLYRAWYPDFGGNLTLNVGGSLTGNTMDMVTGSGSTRPNPGDLGYDTASVGNWLWRQGNGSVSTGTQAQPAAWWINFGSYTAAQNGKADLMVGFTGFGTLGGGNLDVQVAGDAGVLDQMAGSLLDPRSNSRSQGLVFAVGSTGRVGTDGRLQLTGGGDLNLRVSGALNPNSVFATGHLNGAVVNLRGHAQIDSGAIGRIDLLYGNGAPVQSPGETRAYDSFKSTRGSAIGGLTLMPGDATFDVRTLGDLVVMDVADPGRTPMMSVSPFKNGATNGSGKSWFTLWTANTAIDVWSSGGNLTPLVSEIETDLAVVYPSILRAVAASGSLYYGEAMRLDSGNYDGSYRSALLLAPGVNSELQFLAGDSIYGGDLTVSRSGASSTAMATPLRPAFMGLVNGSVVVSNLSADANRVPPDASTLPLFTFDSSSASSEWALNSDPARFYAIKGDLLAVNSGRAMTFTTTNDSRLGQTYYEGTGSVRMMAGRDIVSSGTPLSGGKGGLPDVGSYTTTGNLFIHNNPTDISIVSAGRDILYSNFNVAGPGLLEITAGRNILMDDKVSITSIGAVVPGDSRPGASLVLQAGAGLNGADYERFVKAYLDPANQALAGVPLANQDGKVAKTYEAELVDWLEKRFGFSGDTEQARNFFAALPAEQQRVFARNVYFAELKAGGREYNEVGGVRQGSYLRGREAIDWLFPSKDVAGNAITYKGDITMFGGAGVHTDFGGSIQMLTPGGGQTFGIEGSAPPSTAGVITQGEGDIQLYAQNSILLGQSRIMTTFGGSILGWSAQGDINAGRGSKTTVVYTPPKRLYDTWGNVTLSPSVPSTGAGIATLNPIAEVAPGDIDLIAPLGTIDAGEAGIRVSGNVNIAALTVVNAANIQTQGKSTGVPLAASVNTGAITSASSAASSATQAAEDVARQQQNAARQNQASVFTVQVVSFGSEQLAPSRDGASREAPRAYDPASPVQVLGAGPLDEQNRQRLTEEERGRLSL